MTGRSMNMACATSMVVPSVPRLRKSSSSALLRSELPIMVCHIPRERHRKVAVNNWLPRKMADKHTAPVTECYLSVASSVQHSASFLVLMQSGGFWDFTSDLASKDTAYTSLALGAHTDTTYFSDPAGLQLFHLLSHTEGSGGVSLLVDGFRAASELKRRAPEAYQVLSHVRIPTHASGNDGLSVRPFAPFPVLNHHPVTGELTQIRWNNDDRDVLPHNEDYEELGKWYDAARQWVQLLRSEEAEFWDQLQPGRPLSKYTVQSVQQKLMCPQSSTTGGYCMDGLRLQANDECVVATVSFSFVNLSPLG